MRLRRLRKAFDTIPHWASLHALRRFRVDDRLIRYIQNSLSGCATVITAGKNRTAPIMIRRGVRQGDPISPLLYNLVLDELFTELFKLPAGLPRNNERIMALGYADDILLMSASRVDQQTLVRRSQRFFEGRGMEMSAAKCAHLSVQLVPGRKRSVVSSDARIFVGPTAITCVGAEDSFKYLGFRFRFMGAEAPSSDSLHICLSRLSAALLKPCQKLKILLVYLLPRFYYAYQSPCITGKFLSLTDKMVRKFTKSCLYLPAQTHNAILYADLRGGGLGVPCLSARIPAILLFRLSALKDSQDAHILAALSTPPFNTLEECLGSMIRDYGVSAAAQRGYWRGRLDGCYSGAGLPGHSDRPFVSSWLSSPLCCTVTCQCPSNERWLPKYPPPVPSETV